MRLNFDRFVVMLAGAALIVLAMLAVTAHAEKPACTGDRHDCCPAVTCQPCGEPNQPTEVVCPSVCPPVNVTVAPCPPCPGYEGATIEDIRALLYHFRAKGPCRVVKHGAHAGAIKCRDRFFVLIDP